MMGRGKKELRKKVVISSSDKIKLADLVKNYPTLWSLSDPNHRKGDKLLKCWDEIADEMKLSAADCKTTWKSMKDALRYRKGNSQKQGKSGDSAPEESNDEQNSENINKSAENWEFWECMKFVHDQKATRTTISSLPINNKAEKSVKEASNEDREQTATSTKDVSGTNDDSLQYASSCFVSDHNVAPKPASPLNGKRKSNYDYTLKKKALKPSEEVTEKLALGITDLINLRKESQQTRNEKLEFQSMYVNLDRMLKTLPADMVEELNMEFISLTYTAMKKYKSNSD